MHSLTSAAMVADDGWNALSGTHPKLKRAEQILTDGTLPEPWSWAYLDDLVHWVVDVQQEPLHSEVHRHLANIAASRLHTETAA